MNCMEEEIFQSKSARAQWGQPHWLTLLSFLIPVSRASLDCCFRIAKISSRVQTVQQSPSFAWEDIPRDSTPGDRLNHSFEKTYISQCSSYKKQLV